MKITSLDFKKFIKEEPSYFIKKNIKNLNYHNLNKAEHNKYIIKILNTIYKKHILKSGIEYKKKWENGWRQNFEELKKTKKIKSLIPKYFFKNKISRLGDKLIKTKSNIYDYKIAQIISLYLFEKYLKHEKKIVEFGAGTGHNLLNLLKINKSAEMYALDWSTYSQKIIKFLNKKYKNIYGYNFNYYKPKFNKKIILKNNFSCFTFTSLEQIGKNFKPFIKFLKKEKPKLIINVEPINELLSDTSLLDYLSTEYSKKRNYLDGYYTYLKKMEKKKIIKILEEKKSEFGCLFINGYSILVWKFL